MRIQFGEVILIRMEFHQATGGKVRPGVAVLDAGDDDFVVAPITSRVRTSEFDLPLQEWRTAGLNVPSFVRLDKLTVLAKADIVRRLGKVADSDREALVQILSRIFR